ncbi:NAD(P)/FAD-dependent oxidoreductase [Ornithinimicrobium humiphilum]|uniref:2-polyprenyl-6-methoxyphenol hydroxylase-like FAD-dependent oxidoreductase n=1 Tax=Ornithinimicrobium humiphilum TaxID=125288 RepID=A0A543KKM3_9MICO|nr:NAD(P)/FAD-dependent oxidoreductase [Ornithinimicrobium humiphilum]TQM95642.1 2-polyprenyl-6-methoxyphenol hydroxylase-like FAD-dependent oxidoreductase [Ornithinimicrobium humiphilum]
MAPPSEDRTCDVVVVGAGPCGLYLACLLAQEGLDVVVLERRTEPSSHPRAIGLHPPALDALAVLDLDEEAVARGVAIRAGTARCRGRHLGTLTFERAWPDRPFVLSLPQDRTEALLRARLAVLAPDALQQGTEVVEIDVVPAGVRRLVTRAPDGEGASGTRRWRAALVVGADGARSLVRRRAGIRVEQRTYGHTYLMGDFADGTDDGSTAVLHLEREGIVESFPLPDGVRRWVVHTAGAMLPERPELLADLVAGRTGHRPDVPTSTMVSAFGVRRRLAERMVAGRSVVVGDAAHEISPIGGQGITLGWADARALAPAVVDVVRSGRTGPLEGVAALREVERERLAAARRAARRAELNMEAGRPMALPLDTTRAGVVRALLATPARDRLARAFTMHAG